jgi:hypothetical protein
MTLVYRDRGTSRTQLDIVSGTAVVGQLCNAMFSSLAGGGEHWSWTWGAGPAKGPQQHGTAKAKIEEQWRAWLEAAGLVER